MFNWILTHNYHSLNVKMKYTDWQLLKLTNHLILIFNKSRIAVSSLNFPIKNFIIFYTDTVVSECQGGAIGSNIDCWTVGPRFSSWQTYWILYSYKSKVQHRLKPIVVTNDLDVMRMKKK